MVASFTLSVTTTPIDLLDGVDVDRPLEVFLLGNIYIGGPDVTASNGFTLPSGAPLRLDLHGETIYGVSGGSGTVKVLVISVK